MGGSSSIPVKTPLTLPTIQWKIVSLHELLHDGLACTDPWNPPKEAEITRTSKTVVWATSWYGEPVAVKATRSQVPMEMELKVLRSIRPHKHIIGLRGIIESDHGYICVMERGETTLESALQRYEPKLDRKIWHSKMEFPLQQRLVFLRDIAWALGSLHDQGWIHCDVAARNVLLCGKRAKLCDFGHAIARNAPLETHKMHSMTGPWRIRAPETLLEEDAQFTCSSDVWSFGLLMYSCLAQKRPYEEIQQKDVLEAIRKGARVSIDDCEGGEQVKKIVQQCLLEEQSERPSCVQIAKWIEAAI